MQEKLEVEVYTDGACSGNPGVGGWGVVLCYNGLFAEMSGAEPETTNNQMELTAVIKGLSALKFPCKVKLFSDSAYVVNAFKENWLEGWQQNGWKNAKKEQVKNKELWQELLRLTSVHEVEFIKVKGHADNELNNRCDSLATGEIEKYNKTHKKEGDNND